MLPRLITENTTIFATRRTSEQWFFFKPDKITNQGILYCLGLALMKFPSIRLLVALYMSNHSHLIYEDDLGDAPAFTAELHRNIAKFMNTHLKRKENFWSSDKPSLPVLGDNNDTLMKIVYTMLNPVKAGLVHLPSLWPGAKLLPSDIGKEIKIKRPKKFFRSMGNNLLPAEVTIKLHIPRDYEQTTEGKHLYLQHFNQMLQSELDDIMEKRKPSEKWLGVERIKRVDPFSVPKPKSPLWRLKPNFISADRDKRYSMWLKWKSFQVAYRLAWKKYIDGDHEVEFPLGTYKMRLHHNVKILPEFVIYEMPSPYE